jgi:hypothetical protein
MSPVEIEPAIEASLSRLARELGTIAEALERLENFVALIASAASAR